MQPNSKNFLFGALIAILVITTIIFGMLWIGTKREVRMKNQEVVNLQKQIQELQTKLTEQKPQVPETSGWKTYRNEKYGFEISLPNKNWRIEENENELEANGVNIKERESYVSGFRIHAEFKGEPNSLLSLFVEDLNFSNCQGLRHYKKVIFGRGNYQACQIIETRGDASRALYVLQGNRMLQILVQPLEEGNEADQILSTFKFIR